MITTVIFDLDDTLYDEIDFCRSGFRAVAQHITTLSDAHSADKVFATMWQSFITGDRNSTFNVALAALGISYDDRMIGNLVEIYRTHTPTLTLPPESRTTLESLQGRYTLGLLTDGFLPTQRLKVQALGIERYFQAILYTEELGHRFWKPSPRGFEVLMERLETRADQTVYVADNETKDFIAPNRLGLLTIQLLRPNGLYQQPSSLPDFGELSRAEAAPKRKIDRIGDLAEVLAKSAACP